MSLSPHSFILLFSHLESEHHPCLIKKLKNATVSVSTHVSVTQSITFTTHTSKNDTGVVTYKIKTQVHTKVSTCCSVQ